MKKRFISVIAIILIISLLPAASFAAPRPAPHVDISGEVKAEYNEADVLGTILRIYPEFLPDILELVIPQDLARREFTITQLSKLGGEDVIEFVDRLGLLDIILNNFNPQNIIDLIPNIPKEMKDLLIKIVPNSISNQISLPGTIITVRDDVGQIVTVKIANIKGFYKLNVPGNYEVEYKLHGFETKKMTASQVSDTILLIPSTGTIKGMVTGENYKPIANTKVTVTTAEGNLYTFTDAKGKYEIKGVKPLLPGLAGGIGAHTVLFEKDDYTPASSTAIFVFGNSIINKKLEF